MVTISSAIAACSTWIHLFAQQGEPVFRRLEPATRAKVLAALAGFIILGIALMLFAWMGSRATRRYMNSGNSPKPRLDDDWAKKALDDLDNE